MRTRRIAVLLLAIAITGSAPAHTRSGSVQGHVVDQHGNAIAGAVVTLITHGEHRKALTDAAGQFSIGGLPAGLYTIKAAAVGFRNNIDKIELDGLPVVLTPIVLPAGLDETITVLGEEPLFDVRRAVTGLVVDDTILQRFPSTRDPWAILQTVPGVLIDRVNVAGNESIEHAFQVARGVTTDQSTFAIDGMPITDMIDTGAPPTFFDFESFEEIRVITGGSDPRVPTPGVHMNLITRRGTDSLRGSTHLYWTNNSLQAAPSVPAEASSYLGTASSIRQIAEYGVETGGPLLAERLWAWGSLSRRRIDLMPAEVREATGVHTTTFNRSRFETANLKLNARTGAADSSSLFFFRGDHLRLGSGVSSFRPPETAWNNSSASRLLSLKHTRILSPSLYASVSLLDGRFRTVLDPAAGRDVEAYFDPLGVAHGSFLFYQSERPQRFGAIDASWFGRRDSAEHEVHGGIGRRQTSARESIGWPGDGNLIVFEFDDFGWANLMRPGAAGMRAVHDFVWAGSTTLWRNLVIQTGLRFDRQKGRNLASTVPANSNFPDLVPGTSFAGDRGVSWNTVSPRLGLTWTVPAARRFLIRGSFADYRDQLSGQSVLLANPVWDVQYLEYAFFDQNRDRRVQRGELLYLEAGYNMDPDDPASTTPFRRFARGVQAPRTREWLLGLETEIGRGTHVGLNLIQRSRDRFLWTRGEKNREQSDFYTPADYRVVTTVTGRLPEGESYAVPLYGLHPSVRPPAGYVLENRAGYRQTFEGVELVATRQFDARWMVRSIFTWSDWKQHTGNVAIENPTALLGEYGCNICDGADVVQGPDYRFPTRQGVYVNARWSYTLNALRQLPGGFTAAATLYGREGYPIPYYRSVNPGDGTGRKRVLVTDIARHRHDDVLELDFRIAKDMALPGQGVLSLMLDVFNVTGNRAVLQRSNELNNLTIHPNRWNNRILEMQSPRVVRLGASLGF